MKTLDEFRRVGGLDAKEQHEFTTLRQVLQLIVDAVPKIPPVLTGYVPVTIASTSGDQTLLNYFLSSVLATAGRDGGSVSLKRSTTNSDDGVVCSSPMNRVEIWNSQGKKFDDGFGNEVYGRVRFVEIEPQEFWLDYYSLKGGVETVYYFGSTVSLSAEIPYRFLLKDLSSDAFISLLARRINEDISGVSSVSFLDLIDFDLPPGGYADYPGASLVIKADGSGIELLLPGDPVPTVADVDIVSTDGTVTISKGGTANHPEFDLSITPADADGVVRYLPLELRFDAGGPAVILTENYSQYSVVGKVVHVSVDVRFIMPAYESHALILDGFPFMIDLPFETWYGMEGFNLGMIHVGLYTVQYKLLHLRAFPSGIPYDNFVVLPRKDDTTAFYTETGSFNYACRVQGQFWYHTNLEQLGMVWDCGLYPAVQDGREIDCGMYTGDPETVGRIIDGGMYS